MPHDDKHSPDERLTIRLSVSKKDAERLVAAFSDGTLEKLGVTAIHIEPPPTDSEKRQSGAWTEPLTRRDKLHGPKRDR